MLKLLQAQEAKLPSSESPLGFAGPSPTVPVPVAAGTVVASVAVVAGAVAAGGGAPATPHAGTAQNSHRDAGSSV